MGKQNRKNHNMAPSELTPQLVTSYDSSTMKPTTSNNNNKSSKSKKKESVDCPIFLKKTYHMIDSCDPTIASWSSDGETFLVKDPELFASEVIPQFFKHNNFSSFVRQLNFYGFRKVKNDPIKIADAEDSQESKYWRFRHEKFLKGHPELLSEIRKANQNNIEPEEVHALKEEVSTLKDELHQMKTEMMAMNNLLQQLLAQSSSHTSTVDEQQLDGPNKRPRYDPPPTFTNQLTKENLDRVYMPSIISKPNKLAERAPSITSIASFDPGNIEDLLGEPLPTEDEMDLLRGVDITDRLDPIATPIHSPVSLSAPHTPDNTLALIPKHHYNDLDPTYNDNLQLYSHSNPSVDPTVSRKLHDALSKLPYSMQELFVDRLMAALSNPTKLKEHAEAVVALATAANFTSSGMVGGSQNGNNLNMLNDSESHTNGNYKNIPRQLAVATLEAFLAQYATAVTPSKSIFYL